MLFQIFLPVPVHSDEQLVGGAVKRKIIAFLKQGIPDPAGRIDRGPADFFVEKRAAAGSVFILSVLSGQRREEGIELKARDPSLGQQGAAALDQREEMRDKIMAGQDDGFSQQGAAFGPPDIEGVTDG